MFAPQSHSGFYHCPLSKCFLALVAIASCALSLTFETSRPLFRYDVRAIIERHELWRLCTARLAFLDTKDLICGALIMYYFRIFERRFGPRRFLGCLLVTGVLSALLELTLAALALYVLGLTSFGWLPSGPHGIIFPFFVTFYRDIPRVAFTHLLGVPVTGKSFVYIIGLQMAVASLEAVLVCVCGLLAGYVYHSFRWPRLHSIQPPRRLMDALLKPLMQKFDSPAPADLAQPMGATLELQAQDQMDRLEAQLLLQRGVAGGGDVVGGGGAPDVAAMAAFVRAAAAGAAAGGGGVAGDAPPADAAAAAASQATGMVEVAEEQVQRLIEMGFPRDRSSAALRVSGNDLNLAMNLLLQEGVFS